jgi:hypothetical protein
MSSDSWNMARIASRRPLPKPRKMMGPVGERPDVGPDHGYAYFAETSRCCGYHVCCCKREPIEPAQVRDIVRLGELRAAAMLCDCVDCVAKRGPA